MPQVNPGTVILLLAALAGVAWASGLLRVQYAEGRLTLTAWRLRRLAIHLDLRDTWLLLAFALVMGWAVAIAVERSAWVPNTEGRLVPALIFAMAAGWLYAALGFSRLAYFVASLPAILLGLALWTPSPLTHSPSLEALRKWVLALPTQTNLQLLLGLLLMFLASGLWSSWWIFKRRNGLVALLPTGTILAVEIINDTSPGLVFYTLVWLAAAAAVLLRINFVALKNSWRRRRLPHASDTSWTFGEIGVEATVAILAVAFLLPPLSNADISTMLITGSARTDLLHPFGIGSNNSNSNNPGGIGSIGYSEVVRPGSQLKAKSTVVMIVSGDTPLYSPYWRGIALGGWDGITWYPLSSTADVPVRQQPFLAAGQDIPRDDLPQDPQRTQILHDTFRIVVPQGQTRGTVFNAGEAVTVRNQPVIVRGIMTSVPAPPGPGTPLVNVQGDSTPTASFDTIDRVQLAKPVQPPYTYAVTEAIPNVDVEALRSAGSDYPAWVQPYLTLYYNNRTATGFSTARDNDIKSLAQSIVKTAGAITPYEQAKAIESWFIEKGRFTYTLTPPQAPPGVRPLDYFLFSSKKGFCQDFSTAMNVMLRTLGIPSRQMSGFGLGSYDEKLRQFSVNSLDAHSWVEVYFPGYGWIPFEPTPDGVNAPVNRPATRDELNAVVAPTAATEPSNVPGLNEPNTQVSNGGGSSEPFAEIWRPILIGAGLLLLLLLLSIVFAVRWLMGARDLPRIWKRLVFLGDRLKVARSPGDTPQEFGGRLAASLPDLDPEVRRLAALYTRSRFRRGGLSPDELAEARRAWARVRGSYAALVARAWRDALRHGRVVSATEASASESREPSRRR